jgi:hypothetical protein
MKLLEDVMVEVNGGESKDDRGHEVQSKSRETHAR